MHGTQPEFIEPDTFLADVRTLECVSSPKIHPSTHTHAFIYRCMYYIFIDVPSEGELGVTNIRNKIVPMT